MLYIYQKYYGGSVGAWEGWEGWETEAHMYDRAGVFILKTNKVKTNTYRAYFTGPCLGSCPERFSIAQYGPCHKFGGYCGGHEGDSRH